MTPARVPALPLIPTPIFVAALAVTAAFLLGGVGVPLAALLGRALTRPEGFAAFFAPDVLEVVRFTAYQAALSTAISAVLGLMLGLWTGARRTSGARRDLAWFAVPFSIPTVVAATAWIAWLGRSGPLGALEWSYSLTAVIVSHVFFNIPWVALWVARARMRVPGAALDAAATLGAGAFSRFRAVVWPEIKWPFAATVTQVFGLCVMSFALVLILGGGPPVETLETAIYARLRMGNLDLAGAMACGIWELALGLAPWALVQALRGRAKVRRGTDEHVGTAEMRGPDSRIFPKNGSSEACCHQHGPKLPFFGIGDRLRRAPWLGLLFVAPYFVLWFAPEAWRAAGVPGVAVQVGAALWVSLKLAFGAAMGALAVAGAGVLASTRLASRPLASSALSLAMVVPAGISVLVLGLGFWLAYSEWVDPFEGSLTAMIALQVAIFAPIVYRIFWGLASSIKRGEMEAALTLGASPLKAFREVEWPRWRGPVLAAGAMVAAASLGEVAAVSLFYSEELVPLPLLIARWMGQYRFDEARLVAGLLLALSIAVTFAFTRSSSRTSS